MINSLKKLKMKILLNRKTRLIWRLGFDWNDYMDELNKRGFKEEELINVQRKIQKEVFKIKDRTIKKIINNPLMKTEEVYSSNGELIKQKKIQMFFDNIDLIKTKIIICEVSLPLKELAPAIEAISYFVKEIQKLNIMRFKSILDWELSSNLTSEEADFAAENGRKDIKELYERMKAE